MTDDEYRERIYDVDAYCRRLAFLCPKGCPGDFWHHAKRVMLHLEGCVDADCYGRPRPAIATGIPHLDVDIARHLALFDERWAYPKGRPSWREARSEG